MGDRRKIVIIGGGPAGLSAALSLTDPDLHPNWADEYDVTVLQLGWRVGGKGATGRRGTAVRDGETWTLEGDARIEEHGIHLFGNMYTNAMRTLNRCLDELDRSAGEPATSIEDELSPSNYIQLADNLDRRWYLTPEYLPHNDLSPWGDQDYPGPATLMKELLQLVHNLIDEAFGEDPDASERGLGERLGALKDLIAHHHENPAPPSDEHHGGVVAELDKALAWVRDRVEAAQDAADGTAARLRSVWCQIELYTTVARGVLADDIFGRGIDTVDDEHFIDWCARHGMAPEARSSSAVQLPAQMCFQFPDGDTSRPPDFSAAGFLWFVLRQVLACGQATYWFARGTGDTVIAPFYRVAVARGVEFRFFNKVTDVHYDAASGRIDRIDVDIQATTVDDAPYEPLVRLDDSTWAWPNAPIHGQLVQGSELQERGIDLESWWSPWEPVATETLSVDDDFTHVVLAAPLPCLPELAPELVAHASWAPAIDGLGGSATMAAQMWTNRTTQELGFPEMSGTDRVVGGAAIPPLGYADMTDVLAAENWGPYGDDAPKGLIYLCGPIPHYQPWPPFDDHAVPAIEDERARATFVQWLNSAVSIFPEAGTNPFIPASFDTDALWCPPDSDDRGEARVDAQYWRANIDPNERYVPSPPGTAALRPKAWESGADNLALASDWIFTGINIGSFEGAVMSGMLAAHALTGAPALEEIAGYGFARPGPVGTGD
ncbi:MAG: NAD(P)-binding protein [Acidimicrobiales bacterium]